MDVRAFRALVNATCGELNLSETPELLSQPDGTLIASFVVGDIPIVMNYSPKYSGDRVHIFCHFGRYPEGADGETILRRLLELNLVFYRDNAPTFMCDPIGGGVMLGYGKRLSELTGALVVQSMQAVAHSALDWRKTHFLEPAGGEGGEGALMPDVAADLTDFA